MRHPEVILKLIDLSDYAVLLSEPKIFNEELINNAN